MKKKKTFVHPRVCANTLCQCHLDVRNTIWWHKGEFSQRKMSSHDDLEELHRLYDFQGCLCSLILLRAICFSASLSLEFQFYFTSALVAWAKIPYSTVSLRNYSLALITLPTSPYYIPLLFSNVPNFIKTDSISYSIKCFKKNLKDNSLFCNIWF